MTSTSHPVDDLAELPQSTAINSALVPDNATDPGSCQGVSFLLNGQHYLAPIESISEVLQVPPTTPLPGVQHWVRGITNIRGRPVPIVSLGDFLDNEHNSLAPSQPHPNSRILVIEKKELSVGLIVDEVKGIEQFATSNYSDEIPASIPESMQLFTRGSYCKDQHYVIFSVEELVTNQRFLEAASE